MRAKKKKLTKVGWFKKFFGTGYRIKKVKKGLKTDEILVFGHVIYMLDKDSV